MNYKKNKFRYEKVKDGYWIICDEFRWFQRKDSFDGLIWTDDLVEDLVDKLNKSNVTLKDMIRDGGVWF